MKERHPSLQQMTELEKSEHLLNVPCEGEIHVLITISGTPMGPDTSKKLSMSSVGELTVEVIKAVGLSTKKSWRNQKDLCTVLQVGNSRLQTQTVVNSVNPFFGRTLIFDIEDISEVLEVTVLDDNGDMEDDFMGKVKIPLQSIEDGVERWYRLKCHKSRKGAPGDQPRILLRIDLKYQRLRACKSLLRPLSIKYEENQKKEFEFAVLKRNFKRLNNIKAKLNTLGSNIRSLFQWEDPFKSSYAVITYIFVLWYLELWMIPFIPLLLMAFYTMKPEFVLIKIKDDDEEQNEDIDGDISYSEEMDHADEWTISNKIKELMGKAFWMQDTIGRIVDKVERISNLLSVSPAPFISGVFSCILVFLIILLYLVPLRLILLVWGLKKFIKGLLGYPSKPGKLTNLISRVPTNEQLLDFEELPPVSVDTKKLELIRMRASQDSLVI